MVEAMVGGPRSARLYCPLLWELARPVIGVGNESNLRSSSSALSIAATCPKGVYSLQPWQISLNVKALLKIIGGGQHRGSAG